MVHLIEQMAYVGQTPWHGLGKELTSNQPLEVWAKQAGLDWEIEESLDPALTNTDPFQHLFQSRIRQPLLVEPIKSPVTLEQTGPAEQTELDKRESHKSERKIFLKRSSWKAAQSGHLGHYTEPRVNRSGRPRLTAGRDARQMRHLHSDVTGQ